MKSKMNLEGYMKYTRKGERKKVFLSKLTLSTKAQKQEKAHHVLRYDKSYFVPETGHLSEKKVDLSMNISRIMLAKS